MLDLSIYSVGSYPLTFLSKSIAPRFRAEAKARLPRLKNRIVICATVLCLGWLIPYSLSLAEDTFTPSALPPLADNYRAMLGSLPLGSLHLEASFLLFFALIGVSGGILATWKFTTGGIVLGFSSVLLLLFPGLLSSMFLFNPEFAMLYVLWTSTMLIGGVLSLRNAILHRGSVAEQRQV